jgi:hypothetical protein
LDAKVNPARSKTLLEFSGDFPIWDYFLKHHPRLREGPEVNLFLPVEE